MKWENLYLWWYSKNQFISFSNDSHFLTLVFPVCGYLKWCGNRTHCSARAVWLSAGITDLQCCSAEWETKSLRRTMLQTAISSDTFSKKTKENESCHTLWVAEHHFLYWFPQAQFLQRCWVSSSWFWPHFVSHLSQRKKKESKHRHQVVILLSSSWNLLGLLLTVIVKTF